MPFELKDIIQMGARTIQRPKFEVYDSYGAAVVIDETQCSFALKNASTGTSVISEVGGTDLLLNVDNSDTHAAGNTITTIDLVLDLNNTDITAGRYWLMIYVELESGETDRFKIQIDVIDFESVGETPVS